jgi:hypothetical protein
MVLVATNKAQILEEYVDRVIRVTREGVKQFMPAVIRFFKEGKKRDKSIRFSRDAIYVRDKGRCQYCGCKTPREEMTYDHVLPRRWGGKTSWENIVVACLPCNQKKGDRTPEQAHMTLLTKPVKPSKPLAMAVLFRLKWTEGMPAEWQPYLYWNAELDSSPDGSEVVA